MLAKLLTFALAVFVLVSLFMVRVSPDAERRHARRRAAWRAAMRQTALTVGAVLFLGAAAFGAWHGWRYGDDTGWALGAFGVPAALACGFFAWRASRTRPGW